MGPNRRAQEREQAAARAVEEAERAEGRLPGQRRPPEAATVKLSPRPARYASPKKLVEPCERSIRRFEGLVASIGNKREQRLRKSREGLPCRCALKGIR
jgi:hypothetical protein